MTTTCETYTCGCDCATTEHLPIPDGPAVPFSYRLLDGTAKVGPGSPMTSCPCLGTAYARVLGGGQWGLVAP